MLSASKPKISAVPTSSKSSVSREKSAATEVETPKQIQRRLLKVYEQHCAADDSLALSSVKKTLRAGIQQQSLQARVGLNVKTLTSFNLFELN